MFFCNDYRICKDILILRCFQHNAWRAVGVYPYINQEIIQVTPCIEGKAHFCRVDICQLPTNYRIISFCYIQSRCINKHPKYLSQKNLCYDLRGIFSIWVIIQESKDMFILYHPYIPREHLRPHNSSKYIYNDHLHKIHLSYCN